MLPTRIRLDSCRSNVECVRLDSGRMASSFDSIIFDSTIFDSTIFDSTVIRLDIHSTRPTFGSLVIRLVLQYIRLAIHSTRLYSTQYIVVCLFQKCALFRIGAIQPLFLRSWTFLLLATEIVGPRDEQHLFLDPFCSKGIPCVR